MIFVNSLFKGTLASRESRKISALGKRRLFWLKREAQRGARVGQNSQRGKKRKRVIMNITQPQAEGC